jgi:hypothetical protein
MAAVHLTLEEAAEHLGITPEEFKKRLKTDSAFKHLVPIRDGSNLRFKSAAIEELSRQLGVASNSELPLSPLAESTPTPDSDDFKLPEPKKEGKKHAQSAPKEEVLNLSADEEDIFSLAPEPAKTDSKKTKKSGSDSDVRLEAGKKKGGTVNDDSDAGVVPTEELSIDLSGPGSAIIKGGSSAKLSAPKSSSKIPKPDSGKGLAGSGSSDSSEFELSLDADSDDFELKLNTDTSDEVALGEMPKDTSGSGKRGGESGINLRDPADSGISLEKKSGKDDKSKAKKPASPPPPKPVLDAIGEDSSEEVDFELTLDSSAAASSLKLGDFKGTKPPKEEDSDSEFELTLDDSSESNLLITGDGAEGGEDAEKRDIFETDFEIPPMDESASEAVALESDTDLEKSDVDVESSIESDELLVEEDTSASEVVLLDDDEDAAPAPKSRRKPSARADVDEGDVDLADVDVAGDEEDEASVAGALKGVKGRRKGDVDEDEEEAVGAGAGTYRPVPWGPLPAIVLFPVSVLTLLGGLMAFELLQTMWGYHQPRKPAAPLVRALATNFDMELKDQ